MAGATARPERVFGDFQDDPRAEKPTLLGAVQEAEGAAVQHHHRRLEGSRQESLGPARHPVEQAQAHPARPQDQRALHHQGSPARRRQDAPAGTLHLPQGVPHPGVQDHQPHCRNAEAAPDRPRGPRAHQRSAHRAAKALLHDIARPQFQRAQPRALFEVHAVRKRLLPKCGAQQDLVLLASLLLLRSHPKHQRKVDRVGHTRHPLHAQVQNLQDQISHLPSLLLHL